MQATINEAKLILASASPRRRELLDQIGMSYHVISAEIDETCFVGEDVARYVCRLAREKALHVKNREKIDIPVLAADTVVVIDGRILGKPMNRAEAMEMLHELSGKTHEVWSAVALVQPSGIILECLNVTRVTFSQLSADWISAYCAGGEPLDKAGAYGVQGLAAQKISRLEGSYSCVMGLPLYETSEMLNDAGLLNSFIQPSL